MNRKRIGAGILALIICLLFGCAASPPAESRMCRVVLEDNPAFTADTAVLTVAPGQDAVFHLTPEPGYLLTGADFPGCTLTRTASGTELTIPAVRYSTVVSVSAEAGAIAFTYDANGGAGPQGSTCTRYVLPNHLRHITARGTELFSREGFTLTGWNTEPDGSGISVGLGSRIAMDGGTLYAQWAPWTEEACFTWEENGENAAITGYTGHADPLVIPETLGGKRVIRIRGGAFAGADCTAVIFPQTLRTVEADAFRDAAVESILLFDNAESVSDYAFTGCGLRTLHINAAVPPVYGCGYYGTFADKFDYLLSLGSSQKIVLFSGSSARFGYDSPAIEAAFPEYRVVNMGVFAYTNALPQFLLILDTMNPGDILLHSPEFDAAKRQFCASTALDASFFAMTEGDYDTVARLDLREFSGVFGALSEFLSNRMGMEPCDANLSPWDFDEDGNPTSVPSYNLWGDYILYRPNAETDAPVYGLPLAYTPEAYPREGYLDPANALYARFLERGIRVYMTYAPRNSQALSPESDEAARARLDAYFRENLIIPVISPIEESLYPGTYLFGTDNHLSTEGVAIRTERIIRDLRAQLESEPADGDGSSPLVP